MAKQIKERIKKKLKDLQQLFDFIKTDEGSKLYFNSYTINIQNEIPWYYDALEGFSDGSKVSLEQILILNYKSELKAALDINKKKESGECRRTSCSTVFINHLDHDEQLLFIAYNENEADSNWNTSYILQACLPYQIYRNRLVSSVENEEQLDRILKMQLTAYGFCLNVGRFRSSDDIPPHQYLLSYEISPSNDDGKTNQYHINYIFE
jgi:hypothetical protein